MPRFYFDIHDGVITRDDIGIELPDIPSVREKAMSVLPKVAADEIPGQDDRQHFTVIVSDADGQAVYAATMTYTGFWLLR